MPNNVLPYPADGDSFTAFDPPNARGDGEEAAWRHIKHSLGLYFRVLGCGSGSELDVESLVLVLDMYSQPACTFLS